MNSNLSLNEEINICINNNLTPSELFILRLLFLAQDGEPSYIVNYLNNTDNAKHLLITVLTSLQSKGIILSGFKIPEEGQSLKFTEIPINKNFVKRYIRESNQLGKEIFDLYPPFMTINGRMASIKNITKAGLFSIDDFCLYYSKQIKLSGVTHDRVIEALKFGIEHNLIRYSLLEFISSQKWNEIEYIQQSGDINGYDNTEYI